MRPERNVTTKIRDMYMQFDVRPPQGIISPFLPSIEGIQVLPIRITSIRITWRTSTQVSTHWPQKYPRPHGPTISGLPREIVYTFEVVGRYLPLKILALIGGLRGWPE